MAGVRFLTYGHILVKFFVGLLCSEGFFSGFSVLELGHDYTVNEKHLSHFSFYVQENGNRKLEQFGNLHGGSYCKIRTT